MYWWYCERVRGALNPANWGPGTLLPSITWGCCKLVVTQTRAERFEFCKLGPYVHFGAPQIAQGAAVEALSRTADGVGNEAMI